MVKEQLKDEESYETTKSEIVVSVLVIKVQQKDKESCETTKSEIVVSVLVIKVQQKDEESCETISRLTDMKQNKRHIGNAIKGVDLVLI